MTPQRMAHVRKNWPNLCSWDVVDINPSPLLVGTVPSSATTQSTVRFPRKERIQLPYDPAMMCFDRVQHVDSKEHMHSIIHCISQHNS